ncbi:hypothetical protein F4821DRAFT_249678 [Hypoxylon rubiginosum]|uniref:Uncharacterized protein n=1 Tax=Hypoxylon rubiginosum TaxID=110542 RepID=A0ACC0CLL6_9PEZI|nr:hypothetical protein F4821DRAFT_249678 [Hypoxylon rubiginosum]
MSFSILLTPLTPWLVGVVGLAVCSAIVHGLRIFSTRGKPTKLDLVDLKDKDPDWKILDFSNTKPLQVDFDWTQAEVKPYRPWKNGPYHVTMGLKKTCLDDWVEIDSEYLERYQYKRQLFSQHPDDTIQHLPGTMDACFEALEYLVDFLPRRYPSMFTKTEVGIRNLVTGDDWDLRRGCSTWESYHPLQVMGLLTTEDWFVMQTDNDGKTTRLTAGANCFPAGWKLRERIGHSLWQIHAGKVPDYEQKLAASMDRFFIRLRADRPIMRFNFAVDLSGELFHINSHHNLTADNLETPLTVDQLHLRVERQYLQRLPKTRGLVFSIRTYVTPILEVTRDKEVALALRTSVDSFSPAVSAYKNKPVWNDVLVAHLDEVLAS